ncbi:SDR family NAD(P)-dependent oxidoreductase [Chelativorans salis]|uniref:SDR family oxidoreductase n=1 Tax=Chelativorans salis TaxID=2978478 RepID=A0ABT2LG84_9HYPH|nr:SDR family oxidoreductase [Chelativorans sp. EGI FJ00035]MCT7373480.1 SDR family oxidoreductase [Chelativorans sp. EGI FJ00035]
MNPAAIITGGASGVGLAVAERLLDDGWYVAVVDSDRAALAEAEDLLAGEEAIFLAADVTDEDEVADAFDAAVGAQGLFAALVNCAGIRREAPFEETSAELFRQVLDINLAGAFIAAQAALARMGEGLSIVNLTSVSGLRANGGHAAYGASKAGVKLMSEVMAMELADRGVRVNCVAVGLVETSTAAFDEDMERRRAWLEATPQRRAAEPRDIAAAVAYLLSPEAGFITGHTLVVDGGFSVAGLPRED